MMKIGLIQFLLILVFSSAAFSEVYPARNGNVDVVFTDNTYVDIATKVWMIDNAKSTIDLSAFIFDLDSYGLTMADALRRALNRGVEVRVMYESFVNQSIGKDIFLRITDLLVDPTLKKRAQVLNFTANEKTETRLAINDHIHEKILIVDAGTDKEIIYFGGRDPGEISQKTIDSGYFIRPIDRNLPYIGDDLISHYNSTFIVMSSFFRRKTTTSFAAKKAREHLYNLRPIQENFTTRDKMELAKVLRILNQKPNNNDTLETFQFRPAGSQMMTNEVLKNLIINMKAKSMNIRPELYKDDDILNFIVKMVNDSKKVQIVSYSSHFVPAIQQAFADLLKRGDLYIFTNGYKAMADLDSLGVSAVSYDLTVHAMQALKEFKSNFRLEGNLFVNGLDQVLVLRASNGLKSYLHRKLMLFDDRYVYTGTYNFTESSSTKNNEFMILFDDPRMNAHHTRLNAEETKVYKPLDLSPKGLLGRAKSEIKKFMFEDFVKSQF